MANFNELVFVAAIENLQQQEAAVERSRKMYKRCNAFEMSDALFIRNFRLDQELVNFVINLVAPFITEPSRSSALDVKTKVLVALNFFATGSYQLPIGNNLNMSLSQSSVSRCITEVTEALNRPEIFNEWVVFPKNLQELRKIRNEFYDKFEFPGIIGCIDCTHIAIYPPKVEDPLHPEHIYINRKNYHSINVQLICDSKLKILHVNARFPGRTHDSHIWSNCNVEPALRNLYTNGHAGFFLLAIIEWKFSGDSGYPLRPWLLTPISNPQPESPEENYNIHHKRARCTIERCNGVLKMRFRCLMKHRVLHYSPEKAAKIINSCVILHNICINKNFFDPTLAEVENEEEQEFDFGAAPNAREQENVNNNGRVDPDLAAGRRVQGNIVNNYFS